VCDRGGMTPEWEVWRLWDDDLRFGLGWSRFNGGGIIGVGGEKGFAWGVALVSLRQWSMASILARCLRGSQTGWHTRASVLEVTHFS
jgi:hypothetical protein